MIMLRKLRELFKADRNSQQSDDEHLIDEDNDPRELPRPQGIINDSYEVSATVDKSSDPPCSCTNCSVIAESFYECFICLDILQGVAISSCMICGNYSCQSCAEKVLLCPFCRTSFKNNGSRIRNVALERILSKLTLPCKFSRWGCQAQLSQPERAFHELHCLYAPTTCPLGNNCSWQSSPFVYTSTVLTHLKDHHNLTLLVSDSTCIEIANFRTNLVESMESPFQHCVALVCYDHVYICKLKLYKKQLRIRFFQISCSKSKEQQEDEPQVQEQDNSTSERPNSEVATKEECSYSAQLRITSRSRSLYTSLDIKPKCGHNKALIIPGTRVIDADQPGDDFVKIHVVVVKCTTTE